MKIFSLILLMLLLTGLMSGCGSNGNTPAPSATTQQVQTQNLTQTPQEASMPPASGTTYSLQTSPVPVSEPIMPDLPSIDAGSFELPEVASTDFISWDLGDIFPDLATIEASVYP